MSSLGLNVPADGRGDVNTILNMLADDVEWIPWSPTRDSLDALRSENGIRISASAVHSGALTVKLSLDGGISLSNGALLIRYRAAKPLEVVMTLEGGPRLFQNEIFTRFDVEDTEQDIRIPMPATPGLEDVTALVIRFGDERDPLPVDLTLTRFEFVPAQ